MGARPLAALNLVCWPKGVSSDLLAEVLSGGAEAAAQAECLVVGGHTVEDVEPKYGMAVIGTVAADRILRNRGARPGDLVYLSKPLGTGIIATAIKAQFAANDEISAAVESMSAMNRAAAEAAVAASARAMTDVTGFGLAGHLTEMLGPDGKLGAELSFGSLPVLPGVLRQMRMGMIPAGAYRNRDAYASRLSISAAIDDGSEMLLFDPQTSGGLLAAVEADSADRFEDEASRRKTSVVRIGTFDRSGRISVVP